jgi:hypothetical protein
MSLDVRRLVSSSSYLAVYGFWAEEHIAMMWRRFLVVGKLRSMTCLNLLEADYAKMGFLGCVGSMDVTHLM